MDTELTQIGFGGGCHWCTEAVFDVLEGVDKVQQGWIAAEGTNSSYSEAVLVRFDPTRIPLKDLIHIHLLTHSSSSMHRFRKKYRSAIYTFSDHQAFEAKRCLVQLSKDNNAHYVTQVLPFRSFKLNQEKYQQYYLKHADKPFCKTYINPKLAKLRQQYARYLKSSA
ncbi:peptide-methionine (S)-S-oxide reductase [Kangiella marina]|uniref:peptide-methionine (S)-S-oxide reductase n=1 Tax=Kangiella marina TaxID=1079178 RepID=A0ABP8IL55_9GAMM